MSEMRSIVTGASSKSLVLVDEICRGTETAKGTCIAGSIVETLDKIGSLGIVSTHLHGIFSLPLKTKNTVHIAMGTECIDGRTKPTWNLLDGVCRESLAFETARREGLSETVVQRAEELYFSVYSKKELSGIIGTRSVDFCSDIGCNGFDSCHSPLSSTCMEAGCKISHSTNSIVVLEKEVENAIVTICQKKLIELYKPKDTSKLALVKCVIISVREQPPPSTIGASSVYIMLRPDKKLYVGQTDDLEGRIRAHRSKEGMQNATFIYFVVPGKSLACQLETLLINQLPDRGFHLTNVADGKHRHFGTSNISLDSMTVP